MLARLADAAIDVIRAVASGVLRHHGVRRENDHKVCTQLWREAGESIGEELQTGDIMRCTWQADDHEQPVVRSGEHIGNSLPSVNHL